jgi:hypothetical protein
MIVPFFLRETIHVLFIFRTTWTDCWLPLAFLVGTSTANGCFRLGFWKRSGGRSTLCYVRGTESFPFCGPGITAVPSLGHLHDGDLATSTAPTSVCFRRWRA